MRAGSRVSILLVAMMTCGGGRELVREEHSSTNGHTFTSPPESNPSNWFNSSSIVRCISLSPPEWLSYLVRRVRREVRVAIV